MRRHQVHSETFILWAVVLCLIGIFFTTGCAAEERNISREFKWPSPTVENRPWSRWWWPGSAVDKQNLTELLTEYRQVGMGGVEICPIYGVKGYEQQFKDFLSPSWMAVLEHTLREGKRLNIGVDLTMGTGWPFGGPMVTPSTASSGVVLKRYGFQEGKLTEPLPKESIQYLLAVSDDGERVDVTDKVQQRELAWTPPGGTWILYAVALKSPIQQVKRAAPGGEGDVLDPYSTAAMDIYLEAFDGAFEGYEGPMPRAFFQDSFEYYGATWTADFFEAFRSRRGYDLRDHIEALLGEGPEDIIPRVMCDYHETINDLHLDYVGRWTEWCHSKGSRSRNQAHGAPANLIDLYAASDIPETEIFRVIDEAQIPMLKLSSSAAHLTGQRLASSESFTWLKEHFQASPGDLKDATDFLFLTGVNHIFFHGIPYSPKEAPWPGWQFYASVNFGPTGGLWHDLPAYNAYVTRCQSILQSGKPDNDILLYLPIYDWWHKKEPLHMTFTVHNQDEWLYLSAFYSAAMALWQKGYTYDAVSDQFLSTAFCRDGKVRIQQNEYALILVPRCQFIPLATMEKLMDLARAGATVLFEDSLPQDVPGLNRLSQRQATLQNLIKERMTGFEEMKTPSADLMKPPGKGKMMVANLERLLEESSVSRETAMDWGICFIRRQHANGHDYFFVNRGRKAFDGWLTLGKPARSAVMMDPLYENRIGKAALRQVNDTPQVYLQLEPGQSIILRTLTSQDIENKGWRYFHSAGSPKPIDGSWRVEFIEGGPVLPEKQTVDELTSWTTFNGKEFQRFHGTARYTTTFEAPAEKMDNWLLDLGRVCCSARVTLNGISLGTLWAEPFQLSIGPCLRKGRNTLQIDVTNLAANRIRDLDQRKVNWKYFYDINLVDVNYRPFDASDWPVFDSGLLGPVLLRPQKAVSPN